MAGEAKVAFDISATIPRIRIELIPRPGNHPSATGGRKATLIARKAARVAWQSLPRRQLALLDLARQRQRLANGGALTV